MRPWNQILLILTLGLSGLSAQEASEPVASFERGFYTAPFDVELSAATTGATIYYTTDGSTPSATNGTAYTAPVTISTTTPLRAITTAPALFDSEVMTHTYIFIADVLTQPNDPAGYPDTFAATDENGPYPADYEMDPEIVDHPRYAGNVDDALTAIGTVSIVTDIPNLFDPVTGIYYNPNEKGRIWERQINVEWIDPTGCGVEVTAHAGIRLHGQASRRPKRMPKKNMRLYFRGEYGTKDLDLNLFENRGEVWPPISSFDRIILKNGGNRSWPYWDKDQRREVDYANDAWSRHAALDMGRLTSHNSYAHVYLNGIYWGLYIVAERLDDKFYPAYLGGTDLDYDIIDADEDLDDIPVAKAGTIDAYHAMIAEVTTPALAVIDADLTAQEEEIDLELEFEDITAEEWKIETARIAAERRAAVNADPITDAQMATLATMVDFDDLIDYMVLTHYVGKTDWAHHNWNAYRSRIGPDIRFKFSTWDNDSGLNKVTQDITWKDDSDSPSRVYFRLLTHPEFRQLVGDRLQQLLFNGGPLTPEAGIERYKKITNQISQAVIAESARWGDYSRDVYQRVDAPPGKVLPAYIHSRDLSNLEADPDDLVEDRFQKNWVQVRAEHIVSYFPNRGNTLLAQYRAENWYDDSVIAPEFNQYGGDVAENFSLNITNLNEISTSTVYYTTDGSDPRLLGGSLSPSAIDGGDVFSVVISDVTTIKARVLDDSGNWSYLQNYKFTLPSLVAPLVINEINHKDGPLPSADWIEIHNPSGTPVDVSGYVLSDEHPLDPYTLPASTVVPSGGYLVVARDPFLFSLFNPLATNVVGGFLFGYGSSDAVVLRDNKGQLVDRVDYKSVAPWPTAPNGSGPSLCLISPELDNALPASWTASPELGGSPGADNTKDAADLLPSVELTQPIFGATLDVGVETTIVATASDPEGSITDVEFFANGFSIGTASSVPYQIPWTPVEGAFNLTALVTDAAGNSVLSDSVSVTVIPEATGGALPFLEQDGKVVFEAEHYTSSVAGLTHSWVPTTAQAGYAGDGAMTTDPATGDTYNGPGDTAYEEGDPSVEDVSPMLTYDVGFNSAGSYTVWVRGFRVNGNNDSIHIGINGVRAESVVLQIPDNEWRWRGKAVIVPSAGIHTINLWMREAGFIADRVVVTIDAVNPPVDEGPPESPQAALVLTNIPPTSKICTPVTDSTYLLGDVVHIGVESLDIEGSTSQVEFFANGSSIGTDPVAPYGFDWMAPAGVFELTAVATDNEGATTRSRPVYISVATSAPPAALVINEINYADGPSVNAGDWVEIYNPTAGEVDMSGWKITDSDPTNVFQFPFGTIIPAEGYLVASTNTIAFSSAHPTVTDIAGNMVFGLGDLPGDSVILLDGFNRQADRVDYLSSVPWPLQANGLGSTLCLIDASSDNNVSTSWMASPFDGGTPGRANGKGVDNDAPTATVTAPSHADLFLSGSTIQVEATATDDDSVVQVEFFAIPNNSTPQSLGVDLAAPYTVSGWQPADGLYTLKAVATDNLGAITVSAGVTIAFSPTTTRPTPLVINEINYKSPDNPLMPPPYSDAGDWIELFNPGATPVDLTGWTVRDANAANPAFIIPPGTTIAAGGYLVIVRDTVKFEQVHSSVAYVSAMPFGLGGPLIAPEESVTLYDGFGFDVDSVSYLAVAPWPTEPNGTGPTLCLISPLLDNSLPASWQASPENLGSPGAENGKSTSYAEWASNSIPTDPTERDFDDDPDGDGASNGEEYSSGTNPMVADSSASVRPDVVPQSDGSADVTFGVANVPGTKWELQRSDVVGGWVTIFVRENGSNTSGGAAISAGETVNGLTLNISAGNPAMFTVTDESPGDPRGFYRVLYTEILPTP